MTDSLRVLFVAGSDLHSPDEKQFFSFACGLAQRGHEVMMMLREGAPDYGADETMHVPAGVQLASYRLRGRRTRSRDVEQVRRFAPTLTHALYPRGTVLAASRHWCGETGAPLLIHVGDDEWGLLRGPPGGTARERVERIARRIVGRVHPWVWPYSTPQWLRYAARNGAGFDALTPALAAEVRRRLGRDCTIIGPAWAPPADTSADGLDPAVAAAFDEGPAALYTGAVGAVHEADFRLGLRALAEVQRRGISVRLVHAGPTEPRRDLVRLAAQEGMAPGSASIVGYVPMASIPGLLRRAAVLLSPGAPTEFNRLRLPSKLQAYLASGTPTVTFAIGFGELLEDRREVLKTYTADHVELADRIEEALTDEQLRAQLSVGGPAAAGRLFDPVANTARLEAHYEQTLAALPPRAPRAPSRPRE